VRPLLLFLLLLSGCRYTFWPLVPKEAPPPDILLLSAEVEDQGKSYLLKLRVENPKEAGYLLLRWQKDGATLLEKALFVEAPATYELNLPKAGEGVYKLLVYFEDELVLIEVVGEPKLPERAPPEG